MAQKPPEPYLGSELSDTLFRMNTELLSELWILRDRVRVLEKLLEEKGVLETSAIDDFAPDEAFAAELEKERAGMVRRVVGGVWEKDVTVQSLIEKGRG